MNKGHKATARARPWLFVNQPRAFCFHLRELGANIVHPYRDMMNSRAAFVEKFRDGRVRRNRFKQLDAGFAQRQLRDAYLLLRDLFSLAEIHAESFTPPLRCVINAICRDADVIDLHLVGAGLVPARNFTKFARGQGQALPLLSMNHLFHCRIRIALLARNLRREGVEFLRR